MQNAEKLAPRADGLAVLMREDAGDLVEVGEVVHGPRGDELGEGDGAERGMASFAGEAGGGEAEAANRIEILVAQSSEFIE